MRSENFLFRPFPLSLSSTSSLEGENSPPKRAFFPTPAQRSTSFSRNLVHGTWSRENSFLYGLNLNENFPFMMDTMRFFPVSRVERGSCRDRFEIISAGRESLVDVEEFALPCQPFWLTRKWSFPQRTSKTSPGFRYGPFFQYVIFLILTFPNPSKSEDARGIPEAIGLLSVPCSYDPRSAFAHGLLVKLNGEVERTLLLSATGIKINLNEWRSERSHVWGRQGVRKFGAG